MCTTDRFQACVILESVSFILILVRKQSIILKRRKIKVSKRTWHWLLSNARLFFVWIFSSKNCTTSKKSVHWCTETYYETGFQRAALELICDWRTTQSFSFLAPIWKPSLAATFARKLSEFSTENDHDKIYDVENDDSQLEFVETFDLFDF